MSGKFYMKQNDTGPSLDYELTSPAGVDLTGASVVFNMRNANGTVVVSRATATVASTSPPVLRHLWEASHTATVGAFQAEFEVQYSSGQIETWPNKGYIDVIIGDDIA